VKKREKRKRSKSTGPRLFLVSRLKAMGTKPLYQNVPATASPDNVWVKRSVDTIKPNRALRKQQQQQQS